ncbi:site-specific integrase [Gryllotalpicola kribbensis]|uniref:tyrosine-type recombinase/integrase n=1 Tax=Gryllotalpicola kribbensis TaxID=993084 RepID=UPI0031DD3FA1
MARRKNPLNVAAVRENLGPAEVAELRKATPAKRKVAPRTRGKTGEWTASEYKPGQWRVRPSITIKDREGIIQRDELGKPLRFAQTFYGRGPAEGRQADAERQAYEWAAQIRTEYATFGEVSDKEMTHRAFFREWYAERRDVYSLSANTLHTDEWMFGLIEPVLGDRPLVSARWKQLSDLCADLLAVTGDDKRAQLKASSFDRFWAALRKFYNDAALRYHFVSPLQGHGKPVAADTAYAGGLDDDAIPALQFEQAMAVIRRAMEEPEGIKWVISVLFGLRQGERTGLTTDVFDWGSGFLTLSYSLQEVPYRHGCSAASPCGEAKPSKCPARKANLGPWPLRHGRHVQDDLWLLPLKGKKRRLIPVIDQIREPLEAYVRAIEAEPFEHGLLFHRQDEKGSPWRAPMDLNQWRKILLDVGLVTEPQLAKSARQREIDNDPKVPGTHLLRHTAVSVLRGLGVSDPLIMQLVGHTHIRTTDRYTHQQADLLYQEISKVGVHYAEALRAANPAA